MYENMVDVLIYLYENYMDGEGQPPADQGALEDELSQAGFGAVEIQKALRWLDELVAVAQTSAYAAPAGQPIAVQAGRPMASLRIYTEDECAKLDLEARGFLLFLEHNGILDPTSRELAIERALAIDHPTVAVDELKWVVLLVLMNRPGQEDAFTQMEDLVYSDVPEYLH